MEGQQEEAGGVINDNQEEGGREGGSKAKPPLEEERCTMKEEMNKCSIYLRSHIKRPRAEGGGATIN